MKKDAFGIEIGEWAKESSKTEIWCLLCNPCVKLDHGGINQINQHVKTVGHFKKPKMKFSANQPRFQATWGRSS